MVLAAILLAACGSAERREPGEVRVVSLHDVTTDMVIALGAVDRLVGVAEPLHAMPAVEGVTRVGELESIVAVRPDVVLGLGVVAEQSPELVARLRERGVEVVLADPATLDDVYALVMQVADKVDAEDAGDAVIAAARDEVIRLEVAPGASRARVFVYDCCDPPFTAGGRTVETELIRRAGGANVFAGLDVDWGSVSWEAAVAARPDVIVVHDYAWDGQGDVDDKRAALAAVPTLRDVPVVVVPLGSVLGGLRSVEGLRRLREGIEATR